MFSFAKNRELLRAVKTCSAVTGAAGVDQALMSTFSFGQHAGTLRENFWRFEAMRSQGWLTLDFVPNVGGSYLATLTSTGQAILDLPTN